MKVTDTHFTTDDDKPLFWLADTAWNAALRGDEEDWAEYLDARAAQGFTVIQFVATQWRGRMQPVHGRPFEYADGKVTFDEKALVALDRFVAMVRERGMIPSPVMLWAISEECPGRALSEAACIEVAKHQLERWGDEDVAWMLAGDGNYTSQEVADRWKRIGRAVFDDAPRQVVTMHPCGLSWVGNIFEDEPWFSFVGIQSGHGNGEGDLRFLLEGDYVKAWRDIPKPFVNLEPNYETATAYGTTDGFTDYHVRRASYWSLLGAPPAGVTHGNNAIWIWSAAKGEQAEGHGGIWTGGPWRSQLESPGIASLKVLKAFFLGLPWTELRPAPELLADQPGTRDLTAYVTVAATSDRRCVVAYTPRGGEITLALGEETPPDGSVNWVDPRDGSRHAAASRLVDGTLRADAPDDRDWLLLLSR